VTQLHVDLPESTWCLPPMVVALSSRNRWGDAFRAQIAVGQGFLMFLPSEGSKITWPGRSAGPPDQAV
jgi:hypothetical protein